MMLRYLSLVLQLRQCATQFGAQVEAILSKYGKAILRKYICVCVLCECVCVMQCLDRWTIHFTTAFRSSHRHLWNGSDIIKVDGHYTDDTCHWIMYISPYRASRAINQNFTTAEHERVLTSIFCREAHQRVLANLTSLTLPSRLSQDKEMSSIAKEIYEEGRVVATPVLKF